MDIRKEGKKVREKRRKEGKGVDIRKEGRVYFTFDILSSPTYIIPAHGTLN